MGGPVEISTAASVLGAPAITPVLVLLHLAAAHGRATPTDGDRGPPAPFRLHLGSFVVDNALRSWRRVTAIDAPRGS
jgi:hypothetical protein